MILNIIFACLNIYLHVGSSVADSKEFLNSSLELSLHLLRYTFKRSPSFGITKSQYCYLVKYSFSQNIVNLFLILYNIYV